MPKTAPATTIHVLNGPNLNLLGSRQPDIYGRATLKDVEELCRAAAARHGLGIEFRQSNHEGDLVDWIQQAQADRAAGLVINPAGYTTTSVAILDALLTMTMPVVEVHISNIHAREEFRRHSRISPAATAVICGAGVHGYALAIDAVAALTNSSKG